MVSANIADGFQVQMVSKPHNGLTGTSRYVGDLSQGLRAMGVQVNLIAPKPPPLHKAIKRFGIDIGAFFNSYPLRVGTLPANVYHIPTQTMGTLLLSQRFNAPVILTVLDIIPWLTRQDSQLNTLRHPVDKLFYRMALAGLNRADVLIAISEYTKQTLIDALGIPASRIHVIYPSVDHRHFQPLEVPEAFYARYQLEANTSYVLYVGSEDPRKNLMTLIEALGHLKGQNVTLLKVGKSHFGREPLMERIRALNVEDQVCFFDDVPDSDLPLFYNVSTALILPSHYEGFGYPAVEAMACGTPVIASNASCLPEIVGSAGLLFNPHNSEALAEKIGLLIADEALQHDLHDKGLRRAKDFALSTQVNKTFEVYRLVQP